MADDDKPKDDSEQIQSAPQQLARSKPDEMLVQTPPPQVFQMAIGPLQPLQDQIKWLKEENATLKAQAAEKQRLLDGLVQQHDRQITALSTASESQQEAHKALQGKYESLLKQNSTLEAECEQLRKENQGLHALVRELSAEISSLKTDNVDLKTDNIDLKRDNIDLKTRMSHLETQLAELRDRDHPITVREAMRALEQHLCIGIVGSKRQAKRQNLTRIKDLQKKAKKDSTFSAQMTAYLSDKGLEEQHLQTLLRLKKTGNESTHRDRPQLSENELFKLALDDDDEEEDKATKAKLLSVLFTSFATPNASGSLVFTAPLK